MKPVSEAVGRVAGKSFKRKYIALGRILTHWEDIAGAELACKAQPVRLHYRKHKEAKQPTATLDIAASSADATLLHYRKDLILERINQIFGERWITAIRFVADPANISRSVPKKPKAPLTEHEKSYLSGMLQNIADFDLRGKLEGLGQAVLMEEKQ